MNDPLGRHLRRYRGSLPITHIVFILGVVAAATVALLWNKWLPTGAALGIGAALLAGATGYLAWTLSCFLDIHEYGLVVGRHLGGRRRMLFTEIHPASVRTFLGIDWIRRFPTFAMSPHWYFTAGARRAVTFLGPDPGSAPNPRYPRPPQPGRGLVIFGSSACEDVDAQIRAGMECVGVPAHLARWSAQFGTTRLHGQGSTARAQIPGFDPRTPLPTP